MKVLYHLASLTTAATLMLQLGTFVDASPFFTENAANIHGNDADATQQCQGLRFSFPSTSGLSFEENSKHIIAWQAPGLDKVALSLVNEGDASKSISIGNFAAERGATDELPFDLKGQQPGTYHFHIQATGSAGDCDIDSVAFTINQQKQQQEGAAPSTQQEGQQHSNEDETFDNLVQSIKGQTSSNPHTDSELDELVNDLKHTQSAHSNDQTFDDLVSSLSKSTTSSDADQSLDGLVNDLKQTEAQHSNDQILDGLIDDFKKTQSQQHSDDDVQVLDGLVNDLKSTEGRHANDKDFDDLISDISTNKGNDNTIDSLVNGIKSSTTKTTGHQDVALNSDLDSLSQQKASNDGDDKLDALIDDIAKSTHEKDHQNDSGDSSKDGHDWDAMINDLNSLSSHKDQQEEPKESTQTQGLDQVIDDLAKSIKDEQPKHSEKASSSSDNKGQHTDATSDDLETFESFINSLDQDYTKFLENNKNSETKQVSHKNDAKPDLSAPATEASHDNGWFTNSDLRTKSKIAKRGETNYFTNEDRTSHGNAASIAPPTEQPPKRPVWATNGGYFTNDDQRTNVDTSVHNDVEWAEDAASTEQPAKRPVWATNGGYFTNDDQRTNVDSGVHNDAEWAEDAPITTHPVWSTNGGFFTNDDQRTNVNTGVHNDAEWSEDAAPVNDNGQTDGVWHSDEVADLPEWNVANDETPSSSEHQNGPWETFEHGDEPAYVAGEAPVHHPNDIEWNVHDDSGPLLDHTNFVHWDSEAVDASVENDDDDDHVNAAIEGEWMDDHVNVGEDLEWAQDSIEDFEAFEDDVVAHGNGEWQTDEHANDDDLTDNNNDRWSLNEDVTEWSSNAFDENDIPTIPGNHANDGSADDDVVPEWLSSEHANDDHEDDVTWSMNDGPAEWSVDEESHGNDASISAGDDHVDDATLISEWLTSEHANDDAMEWNVNETPAKWNVNEALEWNVNEDPLEWNVNEDPAEWSVNESPAKWNVNESPAEWTTSEHVNDDDQQQSNGWSLNEDPTEWSTNSIDLDGTGEELSQEGQHSNGANDDISDAAAEWYTSEHANDDHEDDSTWSVNDGPAEWSVDGDAQSMAAVDHTDAAPAEWLTSEHANDDDEDEPHVNADEWQVHNNAWNVNEASGDWNVDPSAGKQHSNESPQWLPAHTEHANAGTGEWQVNEDWATNDVTW